ncbi:unnamed protein product, partial [Laminaria digitata]
QARRAAHDNRRILVTEGYMDVIALAQHGIREAVAPLGTALSESHLALLWKVTNEPYLCFDGDKAGQRAAGRSAERELPLLAPERSLRFITLPAGEDPDSLVSTQGAQAMEELIAKSTPLDSVIWGLETAGRAFDTPERIAGLEKRLEDRALSIADRKVQFQYQSLFRQKLRDMINAARNGGRKAGNNYGGRQNNPYGGGNFHRGGARARRGAASWEDRRA